MTGPRTYDETDYRPVPQRGHIATSCSVPSMLILFLLLNLSYLLIGSILGGYSLLGLCIRPLAATQSFAAGLLILVPLFLCCAVAVGGLFGALVLQSPGSMRWHELFAPDAASETLSLALVVCLPFFFWCFAVSRRPAVVLGVAGVCVVCDGWVCLLASAGA